MNLERIISESTAKITGLIDNAPWYAKLLYAPEIHSVKKTLNKQAKHFEEYRPENDWYEQEAKYLGEMYSTSYRAVEKTYNLIDTFKPIYNLAKKIPIIGDWLEHQEEKVQNITGLKHLPSREGALNVVTTTYEAGLSLLCTQQESTTGAQYSNNWDKYHKTMPQIQEEQNGLSYRLSNWANAVAGLFG